MCYFSFPTNWVFAEPAGEEFLISVRREGVAVRRGARSSACGFREAGRSPLDQHDKTNGIELLERRIGHVFGKVCPHAQIRGIQGAIQGALQAGTSPRW